MEHYASPPVATKLVPADHKNYQNQVASHNALSKTENEATWVVLEEVFGNPAIQHAL